MISIDTVSIVGIITFGLLCLTSLCIKYELSMVNFLTISAILLFTMILICLFASDVLGFVVDNSYRDLLNIMIGAFLTYFNLVIRHHIKGSNDKRDPDKRTRKTDHPSPPNRNKSGRTTPPVKKL